MYIKTVTISDRSKIAPLSVILQTLLKVAFLNYTLIFAFLDKYYFLQISLYFNSLLKC